MNIRKAFQALRGLTTNERHLTNRVADLTAVQKDRDYYLSHYRKLLESELLRGREFVGLTLELHREIQDKLDETASMAIGQVTIRDCDCKVYWAKNLGVQELIWLVEKGYLIEEPQP